MTARWSDPHRLPGPLPVATPGTPAPSPSPMGGDEPDVVRVMQREPGPTP
jgi:hypothetical protein